MDTYWNDRLKTRVLRPDRTYERVEKKGDSLNAQEFFLSYYSP